MDRAILEVKVDEPHLDKRVVQLVLKQEGGLVEMDMLVDGEPAERYTVARIRGQWRLHRNDRQV